VSTDGDLSSRVISTRDFFGRLLLEGDLDDWTLATFRRKNPSFIFDRAKHHPRAGDSLFASAD
jgi:hypothetical protein